MDSHISEDTFATFTKEDEVGEEDSTVNSVFNPTYKHIKHTMPDSDRGSTVSVQNLDIGLDQLPTGSTLSLSAYRGRKKRRPSIGRVLLPSL